MFSLFYFCSFWPEASMISDCERGSAGRWDKASAHGHTSDNAKLDLQSSGKTGIFPSPELSDLFSPNCQDLRRNFFLLFNQKKTCEFSDCCAVKFKTQEGKMCFLGRAVQCDRCGCKEGCKTFSSLPRAVFTVSCAGFQQAGKI